MKLIATIACLAVIATTSTCSSAAAEQQLPVGQDFGKPQPVVSSGAANPSTTPKPVLIPAPNHSMKELQDAVTQLTNSGYNFNTAATTTVKPTTTATAIGTTTPSRRQSVSSSTSSAAGPILVPAPGRTIKELQDALDQLASSGFKFNTPAATTTPSRRQSVSTTSSAADNVLIPAPGRTMKELEDALHQLNAQGLLNQPRRHLKQHSSVAEKLESIAREVYVNLAPTSCANSGKLDAIARELFSLSAELFNAEPTRRQAADSPSTNSGTTTTTTTTTSIIAGNMQQIQNIVASLRQQGLLDQHLHFQQ